MFVSSGSQRKSFQLRTDIMLNNMPQFSLLSANEAVKNIKGGLCNFFFELLAVHEAKFDCDENVDKCLSSIHSTQNLLTSVHVGCSKQHFIGHVRTQHDFHDTQEAGMRRLNGDFCDFMQIRLP